MKFTDKIGETTINEIGNHGRSIRVPYLELRHDAKLIYNHNLSNDRYKYMIIRGRNFDVCIYDIETRYVYSHVCSKITIDEARSKTIHTTFREFAEPVIYRCNSGENTSKNMTIAWRQTKEIPKEFSSMPLEFSSMSNSFTSRIPIISSLNDEDVKELFEVLEAESLLMN